MVATDASLNDAPLSPTDAALLWCSDATYDAARDIGVIADIPESIAAWPVVPADWPADSRARQCDNKDGYLDLETVLIVATRRMRQSNHQLRVYGCSFGLHYHLTSEIRMPMSRQISRVEEAAMIAVRDGAIKVGEVWSSIRRKHFDKQVKVVGITNRSVDVKVIKGGTSQNDRRTRGQPEHIGLDVFLAHYAKVTKERIPQPLPPLVFPEPLDVHHQTEELQEQPTEPMPTTTLEAPVDEVTTEVAESISSNDYDFTDLAQRAVVALERMGGQAVKSYVLTQYFSKHLQLLNAEQYAGALALGAITQKIVGRGIEMGILESWPGERRNNRMTGVWVGLTGRDRTSILPDGRYPGVHINKQTHKHTTPPTQHNTTEVPMTTSTLTKKVWDKAAFQERVLSNIQDAYNKLTAEERLAIATDSETLTHQELQKKYHLMGGVIGMVKREFGVPVKVHTKAPRAPKAPPVPVVPGTAGGPGTVNEPANGAWREPVTPRVRVMRTTRMRGKLVDGGPSQSESAKHVAEEHANFEAEVQRFVESGTGVNTETYEVTLLIMVPREQKVQVTATSFEDALRRVRSVRHEGTADFAPSVVEVVGLEKVRRA